MGSMYSDNNECPVCHGMAAHVDVDSRTNAKEITCARCGYVRDEKAIEYDGVSFWKVTEEFPVSKTGDSIATPENQKWNSREYSTLLKYSHIPGEFGAQEAD